MAQSSFGKILAIETSCDETAAAVVFFDAKSVRILSNVIASQITLHRKTFGVVPELASRAHVEKILPVISEALSKAKLETIGDVDAVAVTYGPGLIGSLLVGSETAKVLSYVLNIPIIPVNHLEGHILSSFADNDEIQMPNVKKSLPALALVVSGGHTELVLIKKMFNYRVIGKTVDDAAGEAFDKIARLLGLPYPGGPAIEAAASIATINKQQLTINLPRPMINSNDFNFSFAGLKTAALYRLKGSKLTKQLRAEWATAVQQAIIDVLVEKTYRAALKYGVKTVLLSGGVSANKTLRQQFSVQLGKLGVTLKIAPLELTTDNAAMIGLAGALRYMEGKVANWYDVRVDPNASL